MARNKDDGRQAGWTDGVVKPKVRWFDGSMYLELRKVAQSAPFHNKLDKVEQLEKRLRDR